ncbi:hypothetical protein IHE45_05G132600 [Dioscorea alata]|uniref:Uncharacterized protein n=1 Tax=Dioscorea alata TaxID=55571 RepID=A0ACB7W574_DIOAL|nr:hypothetical protein IHE45_05G132600 [Dioscorea alata]
MTVMETTKEERRGNAGVVGGETREVTKDEVDEFFAILSRVRDAKKRLADSRANHVRRNGDGVEWRWKPTFQWEDFQTTTSVSDNGTKRLRPAAKDPILKSFDLNAEPEPSASVITSNPVGNRTVAVPVPRNHD